MCIINLQGKIWIPSLITFTGRCTNHVLGMGFLPEKTIKVLVLPIPKILKQHKQSSMFECSVFQCARRFFLPLKPVLNASALGLLDDNEYAEVSTRFKGSHVKRMLWWVAMKAQNSAEAFPHVFLKHKAMF